MVALSAFTIRVFVNLHFGEAAVQGENCSQALGIVSSSDVEPSP